MQSVTKELIKNHRVLRHLTGRLSLTNKRYRDVLKTTQRVQAAHFWFEQKFLFPKLRKSSLISPLFLQGIKNEQKLLKSMIAKLGRINKAQTGKFKSHLLQTRTTLDANLRKEISVLYPLANKVLNKKTQLKLSREMFKRNKSIRHLVR